MSEEEEFDASGDGTGSPGAPDEAGGEDPFAVAETVFQAVIDGDKTIVEARSAMMGVDPYRPKSMYDPEDEALDPLDQLYADAANCFKMALDALEADQSVLATSYLKVARIKLEKARNGG